MFKTGLWIKMPKTPQANLRTSSTDFHKSYYIRTFENAIPYLQKAVSSQLPSQFIWLGTKVAGKLA